MIHELRFYRIAPGGLEDYLDHAGKVAVPFRGDRYGRLLGFWHCEIGAVNGVYNLWEHDDLGTRQALRAELQAQPVWRNDYLPHSQPLMRDQFVRLLFPFAPLTPPTGTGWQYELRCFRTRAGRSQALATALKDELAPPLRAATVALWTSSIGHVNEVVLLTAFRDPAERLAHSLRHSHWRGFLQTHGASIDAIESSLLMPASYSPMR